jgi:hypothetical protein
MVEYNLQGHIVFVPKFFAAAFQLLIRRPLALLLCIQRLSKCESEIAISDAPFPAGQSAVPYY